MAKTRVEVNQIGDRSCMLIEPTRDEHITYPSPRDVKSVGWPAGLRHRASDKVIHNQAPPVVSNCLSGK